MEIPFVKYQGTANDFILIDNRQKNYQELLTAENIAFLCHRRIGIGADGLMLLSESEKADFRMLYYNSDGNESSMCGNGGRCIAHFAYSLGLGSKLSFEAIDGLHEAVVSSDSVKLGMSEPKDFKTLPYESYWIDTGSPHLVLFPNEDIETLDIEKIGKSLRESPVYGPGGTNVNFVNRIDPSTLKVRTFERGVEAETWSCGTGVTACAYSLLNNEIDTIEIWTKGGKLQVSKEQDPNGQTSSKYWLTGAAKPVFEGTVAVESNGEQ